MKAILAWYNNRYNKHPYCSKCGMRMVLRNQLQYSGPERYNTYTGKPIPRKKVWSLYWECKDDGWLFRRTHDSYYIGKLTKVE